NPRVGRPTGRVVWAAMRRDNESVDIALEESVALFAAVSGPTFDADQFRPLAQASIDRSFRPAGTRRQLAAILASPDRTAGLRRLTVPTLVVHGLVDPLVTRSGGIATAQAVPGSSLLMFNDMGHDLSVTRLDQIAAAIATNAGQAAS